MRDAFFSIVVVHMRERQRATFSTQEKKLANVAAGERAGAAPLDGFFPLPVGSCDSESAAAASEAVAAPEDGEVIAAAAVAVEA